MHKILVTGILLFFSIHLFSQDADFPYTTGTWNTDSLGNHRVVIHVASPGDAVLAHIPWRRRDNHPETKNITIQEANSGKIIDNKLIRNINKASGDIIFQAEHGGTYYVYYLPYKQKVTPYLNTRFVVPKQTAANDWISKYKLSSISLEKLPKAKIIEFQANDDFNSFYPMEITATDTEKYALIKNSKSDLVLFPEDRFHPIRMTDDLPLRWIRRGIRHTFSDKVLKNEYYALQIGVLALKDILDLDVQFSALKDKAGKVVLSPKAFTCFNKTGINWDAKPMTKVLAVKKGKVQALWIGIDIPENIKSGDYTANVVIIPKNGSKQSIKVNFNIPDEKLADRGDSDPKRHSRLRWLNSNIGQNDDVIAPYIPISKEDNTLKFLGREITLDEFGFPKNIKTFFNPSNTHITTIGKDIINAGFRFLIDKDNLQLNWTSQGLHFTKQNDGTVEWTATSTNQSFEMTVSGKLDFDGFVNYQISLRAKTKTNIDNILLEVPYSKEASQYILGLGNRGGYRPQSINWKWDVAHLNQDALWLGDINAGMYIELHDNNYHRPLNTNFYLQQPLKLPDSWGNDNKGGFTVEETANNVLVKAYSGKRTMQADEIQHFDFNLLITPFKTLDTEFQFTGRFYHKYAPVNEAKSVGANIINIHHGNEINPYINYPFIRPAEMKNFIDEAHSKGIRVKIYNTIRELSYQCKELFAIRSLGNEVFSSGKGFGHSWLQEHLDTNYIAAWYCAETNDAAIVNSGMSRWHNYYVEGMKWLVDNVGIDGIYLDDIAFDRTTMRRIRRMLNSKQPFGLIDLHSCNQFNKNDGFINSALLYMDQFPYINRLWFGEEFKPNSEADFYLVEMSGIPFGLMGEMLQDGGNQYYGVIHGMISRLGWSKDVDPRAIWKVWDDFGIKDSEMYGWWATDCPIKTNQPNTHASAFVKNGKTLIAVANWDKTTKNIKLDINWQKLGIDPAKAKISAPSISNFQEKHDFSVNDVIPIESQKGWILIVE